MKGQTQKTLRPFGMRDKLGYMFGDFGNDFTFLLSSIILTKFYTDVMGVSAGVVGTLMMVARFIDVFTDVTMGRIVDAAKPTAAGKFKPWIKRVCLPVAIASFLMYAPGLSDNAASWPMGVRIAYLCVTYILWGSICYTGINIPYGSMASAISAEPADRQELSTFRTIGSTLAGLVINVVVPLVAFETIETAAGGTIDVLSGKRTAIAALCCSILAVVCYLLTYNMITERVPYVADENKQKQPGIGTMLKNAVKNRALISIIVASIMMLLAQLTMQNMNAYIYPDYYGNSSAMSIAGIGSAIGMMLAAAVVTPLTKKFGKAEVAGISSLAGGVICLLIWFLKPASVWMYIVLQTINFFCLGMFGVVCWAMITDVIDYSEIKNGVREDGSVYALYSFARKLGQALAAGVSGWMLTAIGYNENASSMGIAQTASVKTGMLGITTLIPAAGFILLAVVLLFWYPLHKMQVEENNAILKAKREA